MKFLVVSATPSHPQNAGNRQRINILMQRLTDAGHDVHFCFIRREWVTEEDVAAMRAAWSSLTLIPYNRQNERKSKGDIFGVDDWCSDALLVDIKRETESIHPDVVISEYVFLSRVLMLYGPEVIKIVDTHDIFGDRHLNLQAVGLEPSFFYTSVEEEARGLNRADIVIAIQDEEARYLQQISRAAVITIGVMESHVGGDVTPIEDRAAIGYIGSGNPLNMRSVRRFLQAVEAHSPAPMGRKVQIGGGASSVADEMPQVAEAVPHVPYVRDFYDLVDLCVNPHEGGTGLKIKTVEALGFGRPVIGTAEAFAGLEPRETFHSAANALDVGDLAVRYAKDPAFRTKVRSASSELAYRYKQIVDRQFEILGNATSLRGTAVRPRMLIVTDISFWHESLGNQARIAEQIRVLRHHIDIDVLVFRSLTKQERAAAMKIVGGRGNIISFKDYSGAASKQAVWVESSRLRTPFEAKAFSRQYFATLEEHLSGRRYEAVMIQYIRLSYLRHARGMPRLTMIDVHDIMSQREANFAHFGLDHFIKIAQQEELSILSSFDMVLAIQAREYEYLNDLFPGRAVYFPHVQPSGPVRSRRGPVERIVFVGGDSPMNRDALKWFLDQIWPCFSGGTAKLHIAGDVCTSIQADLPNVVLHGRVADLPAFLHMADLAINPVYYGGGLKIKTVEYLCYGIPAVLTLEAADGVFDGFGEAFVLAETRAQFVEGLQRLIYDTDYRQLMSEAAFALGRRMFGHEAVAPSVSAIAAMLRAEK